MPRQVKHMLSQQACSRKFKWLQHQPLHANQTGIGQNTHEIRKHEDKCLHAHRPMQVALRKHDHTWLHYHTWGVQTHSTKKHLEWNCPVLLRRFRPFTRSQQRGRSPGLIRCWSCHGRASRGLMPSVDCTKWQVEDETACFTERNQVAAKCQMADKAACLLIRESHARCVERSVDRRLTR